MQSPGLRSQQVSACDTASPTRVHLWDGSALRLQQGPGYSQGPTAADDPSIPPQVVAMSFIAPERFVTHRLSTGLLGFPHLLPFYVGF